MRDCNQDVTIWNELKGVFYRHIIPVKCKWKSELVRTVSGTTANIADNFVVIIPYSDMYKPPEEWILSNEDERKRYFTLNKGDIMALGAITADITGVKPYTKSEIKQMFAPNSLSIKVIQDNTMSAKGTHWRVSGN